MQMKKFLTKDKQKTEAENSAVCLLLSDRQKGPLSTVYDYTNNNWMKIC